MAYGGADLPYVADSRRHVPRSGQQIRLRHGSEFFPPAAIRRRHYYPLRYCLPWEEPPWHNR